MKEEQQIKITKLEQNFEFIKASLNEVKGFQRELQKSMNSINNSLPSIRNDVNLANQVGVENRIRISKLETQEISRQAQLRLIYWVLSVLGVPGIIAIVVSLVNFFSANEV